jgi:predicted small metal-binding protein
MGTTSRFESRVRTRILAIVAAAPPYSGDIGFPVLSRPPGMPMTNELKLIAEARMERLYAECGELPSEGHCSTIIAADSEAELLEAAAKHACEAHGHKDCPELRNALRRLFHEGAAPGNAAH